MIKYHILLIFWNLDRNKIQTILGLAGLIIAITIFIALVAVSWQSWRAASRNPVEALRYE